MYSKYIISTAIAISFVLTTFWLFSHFGTDIKQSAQIEIQINETRLKSLLASFDESGKQSYQS